VGMAVVRDGEMVSAPLSPGFSAHQHGVLVGARIIRRPLSFDVPRQ
jgi:hypothetical protein